MIVKVIYVFIIFMINKKWKVSIRYMLIYILMTNLLLVALDWCWSCCTFKFVKMRCFVCVIKNHSVEPLKWFCLNISVINLRRAFYDGLWVGSTCRLGCWGSCPLIFSGHAFRVHVEGPLSWQIQWLQPSK